jgi:integrase
MAIRLNDAAARALKPRAGVPQYDVADELTPGLILRVGRTKKTWLLRVRSNGNRDKEVLGLFPSIQVYEARMLAGKILRELREDGLTLRDATLRHLGIPKADPTETTLQSVIDEYKARELDKLAVSTQKEWARLIAVEIEPTIGTMVLDSDVRSARKRVRDTTDAIVTRGSPYTACRTWEVIRRLIGYGIQRDLLDPSASGIFANMQRPAEEKGRTRVLKDDEIKAVLKAVETEPPIMRVFWKLAFLTGQRRGEILGARWDQMDLEKALWSGFTVKGGGEHVLPLPKQAVDMLKLAQLLSGHTPFVVTGPKLTGAQWSPQKSVQRVQLRSGVEFRIHDVRRTVATGLAAQETEQRIISLVLSHRLRDMDAADISARVYIKHGFITKMRTALQTWADRLDEIAKAKE